MATYILSLILIGSLSNAPLHAQGEASMWGSVSDMKGAAIADATVTIRNIETGAVRAVVTDEAGRFNVLALIVGHYEVAASKIGFQVDRKPGISLAVGQREEVDLT